MSLGVREVILQAVDGAITDLLRFSYAISSVIPGASVIAKYIQNSYQHDPIRIVLELLLVLFALRYMSSKRYKPDTNDVELSNEEVEELIADWKPESLVPPTSAELQAELASVPVIQGPSGPHIRLASDGKEYLNLMTMDFLGLSQAESITKAAMEASRKYGVGACGPPGFYGTIDVHMELERDLAKFMGTEQAIIYSQAFSTISSVIPAFSKRGDILVCDEGINFAIQKGVQISRIHAKYFKHNDMEDLERILKEIKAEDAKSKRPLTRRFIVVEGLYQNSGVIADIPKLIELKKKYKYRLIVDESLSFGVLGDRGAGVSDHFHVDARELDVITGSMTNALASAGGFCVGSQEVVDHQRLSGASYCFSAAMPAMLAVASIEGLKLLGAKPDFLTTLRNNIKAFRKAFGTTTAAEILGDPASPALHLRLTRTFATRKEEDQVLQKVVETLLREKIAVTRAKYIVDQEQRPPRPSIRVFISAAHNVKELEKAGKVLRKAVESCAA